MEQVGEICAPTSGKYDFAEARFSVERNFSKFALRRGVKSDELTNGTSSSFEQRWYIFPCYDYCHPYRKLDNSVSSPACLFSFFLSCVFFSPATKYFYNAGINNASKRVFAHRVIIIEWKVFFKKVETRCRSYFYRFSLQKEILISLNRTSCRFSPSLQSWKYKLLDVDPYHNVGSLTLACQNANLSTTVDQCQNNCFRER